MGGEALSVEMEIYDSIRGINIFLNLNYRRCTLNFDTREAVRRLSIFFRVNKDKGGGSLGTQTLLFQKKSFSFLSVGSRQPNY